MSWETLWTTLPDDWSWFVTLLIFFFLIFVCLFFSFYFCIMYLLHCSILFLLVFLWVFHFISFFCAVNKVLFFKDQHPRFRPGCKRHDGICSLCVSPINKKELPLTSSLLREPERDRYEQHLRAISQYTQSAVFTFLDVAKTTAVKTNLLY